VLPPPPAPPAARTRTMGLAKTKPLFDPPTDIEDDLHAWCFQQAELLRHKRFAEADLPNIIEELESMGRSERRALRSSYRLLIAHLLKWQMQPQMRSRSWQVTIGRERARIRDIEAESPSLLAQSDALIEDAYPLARREAAVETGLDESAFPSACPYDANFLRDLKAMPE
jgi:hypothetical protein